MSPGLFNNSSWVSATGQAADRARLRFLSRSLCFPKNVLNPCDDGRDSSGSISNSQEKKNENS